MIPTKWVIQGLDGIVQIDLQKDRFNLINVNRTVRHRFTQLIPSIQVPLKRFGMGIVIFGTDVAVYGVCQGNSIGSFEGNGQLVRHLAGLVLLVGD
jgi:hypothetical protein